MFYKQLQEICKQKNTNITSVLKELNISTGNTGAWKKGKLPTCEIALKIADLLNTSVDYLLTGERGKDLSEDEKKLLHLYSSLSADGKGAVKERARTILEEEQEFTNHKETG